MNTKPRPVLYTSASRRGKLDAEGKSRQEHPRSSCRGHAIATTTQQPPIMTTTMKKHQGLMKQRRRLYWRARLGHGDGSADDGETHGRDVELVDASGAGGLRSGARSAGCRRGGGRGLRGRGHCGSRGGSRRAGDGRSGARSVLRVVTSRGGRNSGRSRGGG